MLKPLKLRRPAAAWFLYCVCTLTCAGANTRIFVGGFGDKPGATQLRSELVSLLRKQAGIAIADSPTDADFLLSGSGETYIKGYLASNPRVHYLNSDARPVYAGFLSVELKNHAHDTVWSYLVTPSRFGSEDINRNLASQIIHRMNLELRQLRKAIKP